VHRRFNCSFFLLPQKLSGSILDVYSGEQGISPVNMGLTSASCPSSLPLKKEITGNVAFYSFVLHHFCQLQKM
jgi:hypothetical protein